MAIEWLERNFGLIVPRAQTILIENSPFEIILDQEELPPWRRWMNGQELEKDTDRLLSMKHPWAFLVGALTRRLNPLLGRLPDNYIYTIHGVANVCEEEGINIYECFRRQEWGAKAILAKDAQERDGYAVRKSNIIIALPGSSISRNTPEEIRYATQLRKPIIYLYDRRFPEEEFINWFKRRTVINSLATVPSAIISYEDEKEMHANLREVLFIFKQELGLLPEDSQRVPRLIA